MITVLLAAYNGEKFLPKQLGSLRKQTADDFRVILQDDGSSDNTPQILRGAFDQDARFRLGAENGRHLGAIGNFMSLMRQTEGGYTALCDQDDEWEPDRLEVSLRKMLEAEDKFGSDVPILVHTDSRLVDENGNLLAESFYRHQGWDPAAVQLNRLLVQNNVTGCTVLMNEPLRRLACEIGKPEKMVMHDWFLALLAASFGHVVFVRDTPVRYCQHTGNVVGASHDGLVKRGFAALGSLKKGFARMRLTYTHTKDFRDMCGERLPEKAADVINAYLKTQKYPKILRVPMVLRGGYRMQSTVTRIGQILFG